MSLFDKSFVSPEGERARAAEIAFREELAALFNKHGKHVSSCGCCGGTFICNNDDDQTFTASNVDNQ